MTNVSTEFGHLSVNADQGKVVHVIDRDVSSLQAAVVAIENRGYRCQGINSVASYAASFPIPDCVVVGAGAGDLEGSGLEQLLGDPMMSLPVVAVSSPQGWLLAPQVLERATTSLLPTTFAPEALVAAVNRSIHIGEVRRSVQERFSDIDAAVGRLSPREKEVLTAIINGQLNKAIARSLDVSVRTVEGDRAKIVEKFEAETTGEVVGKFAQYKLLTEMGYPALGSAVLAM